MTYYYDILCGISYSGSERRLLSMVNNKIRLNRKSVKPNIFNDTTCISNEPKYNPMIVIDDVYAHWNILLLFPLSTGTFVGILRIQS